MSLVRNERTKYLATLVNTVAAASVTAGVVAPLVALTYGVPGPLGGSFTLLISLAWFLAGVALHFVVRVVLGKLRE